VAGLAGGGPAGVDLLEESVRTHRQSPAILVLAEADRVVVLCTVAARRLGRTWSSPEVHVWRVLGGRAVEFREYQGDQQTEDEFWSAQG
jgi:ketosteroid isomerase-like protein